MPRRSTADIIKEECMYDFKLHEHINKLLQNETDIAGKDNLFYTRFIANASAIKELFDELYMQHSNGAEAFDKLLRTIITADKDRAEALKQRDLAKSEEGYWFLSNKIAGMSLYVDRFCGSLKKLGTKLSYFEKLGVNFLHLMPVFESPANESDGGYAVSNFRKVDRRFGTLDDLKALQEKLLRKDHVPDD
jgi:amylosucrase